MFLLSVSIEPLSDEAQNHAVAWVAAFETELLTVEVRHDDTIITPTSAVNKKDWLTCPRRASDVFAMYKVKGEKY